MSGATVPAVDQAARRRKLHQTALIVAAAMFMEQLDGTVIATALPDMARSFGADPLHMSAALTAYLLSLAMFIPVSGPAADRFGSRTVFRAAIALFTLGSILCGRSESLPFLIFARIVQGVGGAMMVPVGRLVLLRSASKSELVAAMTWLMIPATIGPIIGPPLGGFVVTYFDWRWIFYVNVPVGVIGFIAVTLFIAEIKEPAQGPFDLLGFALSSVSLVCLLFGVEIGSRGVGSLTTTAILICVGLVTGALYLRHAKIHPRPVLDLSLMRIPTFGISVLAGACSRIAVGAMPFLLPMMMQIGFGLSAAQSGLITFASAGGSLTMRAAARPLLQRFGFRRTMIWIGLIAVLLFAAVSAFRPYWPQPAIYAVLFLLGFFQSLQFMAYNTVCYADIPRARMSSATSFYTTFQQLCLSFGIATGAAALAASRAIAGHATTQTSDFSVAFLVVASVAIFAPLVSARLPADAGAELTGHKPVGPRTGAEPAADVAPVAAPVAIASPATRRPTAALLARVSQSGRRRGRV